MSNGAQKNFIGYRSLLFALFMVVVININVIQKSGFINNIWAKKWWICVDYLLINIYASHI